ncbi:hypothetical protein M426DRAFT_58208 [Hypoxylon sp. CI-4A]|nr:hypothetical protein M426DRAFT_58208 [Hypoxylon sp. CI-4A]
MPIRPLNNDINDYDVDDDPFAESENEAPKNGNQSKKRKEATGLGIDEAVNVQKKARVPMVKLDEGRLLSEKGIPRLRRKARDLKFKGKGHEFSDAARLLSFYQLWFDDLFPKAKFLDAAAMAEKAGHKKYMRMKRMEWIDEGKPKPAGMDDDGDLFGEPENQTEERAAAIFPARVAPVFENRGGSKAQTPPRDDVPGDDEDIYSATPRASRPTQPTSTSVFGNGGTAAGPSNTSLFGNGGEPDEDDLDALMAEEEAQRPKPTSLFGNGDATSHSRPQNEPDEDDLDALMAESESQPGPSKPSSGPAPKPARVALYDDEGDDLDALMAEAESREQAEKPSSPKQKETEQTKEIPQNMADADEEAAMAEMDGLW